MDIKSDKVILTYGTYIKIDGRLCVYQNKVDKIEHLFYSITRTNVLKEKENRTWKEMTN